MKPEACVTSILLAAVFAARAWAGAPSIRAESPFVFRDAAVNVVVVPYLCAGGGAPSRAFQASYELPLLIQANMLLMLLKYGRVGTVHILRSSEDGDDAPEVVEAKLLGRSPGALAEVAKGHGLVMVWGCVYEDAGEVHVQSYLRFQRRGTSEQVEVKVDGKPFGGEPSAQTIAFAPQTLTRRDLDQITHSFGKATTLRTQPRDDAPGIQMPIYTTPGEMSGYAVMETSGEWMEIRSAKSGAHGWLRAGFGLGDRSLAERLPELHMIEAVAGYLRHRVAIEGEAPAAPDSTLEWIYAAFDAYATASGDRAEPLATAVGEQLLGMTACLTRGASAAVVNRGWDRLMSASRRVDFDADALDLEIVGRLLQAQASGGSQAMRQAVTELEGPITRAVALEPRNEAALRNLQSFYELTREATDGVALPSVRIASLKRIRKASIENSAGFVEPSTLVELNRATFEELRQVPGMSAALAERIIAARPLRSKNDLLDRKLVDAETFEKIRNRVYVEQTGALRR